MRGRIDKEEKHRILLMIERDIREIKTYIPDIEFREGKDELGILFLKDIRIKIRRQSIEFLKIIKALLTEDIKENNVSNSLNPIIANLEKIGLNIQIKRLKEIGKIGKYEVSITYKNYTAIFKNILQKDLFKILYVLDYVRREKERVNNY